MKRRRQFTGVLTFTLLLMMAIELSITSCSTTTLHPQQALTDPTSKETSNDPRARIQGQKVHYDEDWDYSFWAPMNWSQYDMVDQRGVVYAPEQDLRTGFYVLVKELGRPMTETDLPALRIAILRGIEGLPNCEILHETEIAKGSATGFEFVLTFTLDGAKCKRRMRVLYRDRQQFIIYGQAVSVEEYDIFKSIFDYMYLSFTFGDLRTEMLRVLMPVGSN